ncbi:MAG: sugar-binding protein [Bacteroidales bacterium]
MIWAVLAFNKASAQGEKHYTCYKTSGLITIDGHLDEQDWGSACWTDEFVDITGASALKPEHKTQVKLLWDDNYLYVAALLEEADVWASIHKKDDVIFYDNDFEIFLDPDGNGKNYYEIEVNAFGTIWDLMLTKSYDNGGVPLTNWDLKGLRTGIQIHGSLNNPSQPDTSWVVEMALPLDELMDGKNHLNKPSDGVQWRLNFSRVEWKTEVLEGKYIKTRDPETSKPLPEQNWVWSPMGEIAMHIPERWGWLEFSGETIRQNDFIFKDKRQKAGFKVWLWMGGYSLWSSLQWDSLFTVLNDSGIYGILTQADAVTLKTIIPLARKHDVHVEKWFITLMNNDSMLISDHPDWFVVNRDGLSSISNPAYVGYYRFLCPSNPGVRVYLESKIDEYLAIPGLEGIHLDYIRFPDVILPGALWSKYGIIQDREYGSYDYCYCERCRQKYSTISGNDPLGIVKPEEDIAWRQFRYKQITSIVSELAETCHARGKRISAAVFPGPSIARKLVRQSWEQWPLDEYFPMLYQSFYYGSLDWIRLQTSEGIMAIHNKAPLYSGLFLPSLNPRELHTAIQKCIAGGACGISIFNLESITSEHWRVLNNAVNKSKR